MKPKTTKFINLGYNDEWYCRVFQCSECKAKGLPWDEMNYCPVCGREIEV